MKNKHIELVKKWLADNDSVSHAELEKNADDADDASDTAAASAASARAASYAAAVGSDASYWVKKYEELTK